jgi:hypothetical protein
MPVSTPWLQQHRAATADSRSCHAQGSRQRPSRQGFYLVTHFWNLKKVLALSTRRYYTVLCITATGHLLPPLTCANPQSHCGSDASRWQTTGVKAPRGLWMDQMPGEGFASMSSQIRGRLARISLPLAATTLRNHSRGQASDQNLTGLLTGFYCFGPGNDGGSSKPQLNSAIML